MRRRLFLLAFVVLVCTSLGTPAGANVYSRVYINGVAVPVYFNDGDSFRVFDGAYRDAQCRLGGFNTLESFGPAHQWGTWHPYELYTNAKMATFNARRGTWHCMSDGTRDTYGRLILDCPDLAIDQIRHGYAQAYQVDDTPSRPEYLRAQQDAIRNRRGMWAHGVPDYVMTSVHSALEDPMRTHYNRLVSTRDGHTESMQHHVAYSECEWVCNDEIRVDMPAITAAARRLREDPELSPMLGSFFNLHLIEIASRFRRVGELPGYVPPESVQPLRIRLEREAQQGLLGDVHPGPGACMINVPFEHRYGQRRAACLNGHGNWHGGHQ